MTDPAPRRPFWHPLSLWQVLGLFFLAQIVANLAMVALREGLGWPIPQWVAGGLGGVLGVLAVGLVGKRRLAAGG